MSGLAIQLPHSFVNAAIKQWVSSKLDESSPLLSLGLPTCREGTIYNISFSRRQPPGKEGRRHTRLPCSLEVQLSLGVCVHSGTKATQLFSWWECALSISGWWAIPMLKCTLTMLIQMSTHCVSPCMPDAIPDSDVTKALPQGSVQWGKQVFKQRTPIQHVLTVQQQLDILGGGQVSIVWQTRPQALSPPLTIYVPLIKSFNFSGP